MITHLGRRLASAADALEADDPVLLGVDGPGPLQDDRRLRPHRDGQPGVPGSHRSHARRRAHLALEPGNRAVKDDSWIFLTYLASSSSVTWSMSRV